jgi:hypothetical protein
MLVVLTGFNKAGKRTVAKFFETNHRFVIVSFDEFVKQIMNKNNNDYLGDNINSPDSISPASSYNDFPYDEQNDSIDSSDDNIKKIQYSRNDIEMEKRIYLDIFLSYVGRLLEENKSVVIPDIYNTVQLMMFIHKYYAINVSVIRDVPEWYNNVKNGECELPKDVNYPYGTNGWMLLKSNYTINNNQCLKRLSSRVDSLLHFMSCS